MRFDIITIFPEFFAGPLDYGIVRRARQAGLIETHVHDLRRFTHDRHRTVDDRPFGGGAGMVMKPEPIFEAVESLLGETHPEKSSGTAVVLLSASGKLFRQETAREFAGLDRIVLLCGRYEGVDERVAEHLATHEISVGDFVLSGGELPAAMIVDAVARLIPGALGNMESAIEESFSAQEADMNRARHAVPLRAGAQGHESQVTSHDSQTYSHSFTLSGAEGPLATSHCLLDYPHYTRPQSFRGWEVPEVLVSGNHEEIRRWRRQKALEKTRRNRPDLLATPAES